MFRLILVLAFCIILVLALGAAMRAADALIKTTHGDIAMPDTFQRIAYVVLIVLLFGVCTGWLGAA